MVMINQDLEMYSGDFKLLSVSVTDALGLPKDLTSSEIQWALKLSSLIKLEKDNLLLTGITITDATGGIFEITIDCPDTFGFLSGNYVHQAKIIDSSGRCSTVLTGVVTMGDSMFD